jgi:hypothetical protein
VTIDIDRSILGISWDKEHGRLDREKTVGGNYPLAATLIATATLRSATNSRAMGASKRRLGKTLLDPVL